MINAEKSFAKPIPAFGAEFARAENPICLLRRI